MTQNKRIFWNFIATYGRSVFALFCGVFTGRWVLLSLGKVDYGLYGVVGGLTAFISFFNGILASAVGRFYAYSVGEAKKNPIDGLQRCREWFTIAAVIHLIVPTVLIVIGYPIGVWAVKSWLTIPAERVASCVWVFRFTCITCYISMITVPVQAMYVAKQEIAELTIYSFVQTTLNVVFSYYMLMHPGDWLLRYALWMCVLSLLPSVIIATRGLCIFPECRLWSGAWRNVMALKRLLSFAGWNFFGALGGMLNGQGMAILVNKYFGPVENAALSVANSLSGHANTLSCSLVSSLSPAITNAVGSGDKKLTMVLFHSACKISTFMILIFVLPLVVEVDTVMTLWLKTPPVHAGGLCVCVLVTMVLERLTSGHWMVMAAYGRIAKYQFVVGTLLIAALPFAWGLIELGLDIYAIGYAIVIAHGIVSFVRVFLVRSILSIPQRYWLLRIFLPIIMSSLVSFAVGLLVHLSVEEPIVRLVAVTASVEGTLLPLMWLVVLDAGERDFILAKLSKLIGMKAK